MRRLFSSHTARAARAECLYCVGVCVCVCVGLSRRIMICVLHYSCTYEIDIIKDWERWNLQYLTGI